jgi:hypothetical protein
VENPHRPTRCAFGPSKGLAWLTAGGAVVAVVLAIFDGDPAGRLLVGVAAVVLAIVAAGDLVFAPRLIADADGLQLRTPSVRAGVGWARVERVELDERNRLGLTSRTLEIDAGDVLVVLSRHALGTDPRAAYDLIRAFEPR